MNFALESLFVDLFDRLGGSKMTFFKFCPKNHSYVELCFLFTKGHLPDTVGQVKKSWEVKSHRCQLFFKKSWFLTFFAIFLLFLPNGWLLTPVDDRTKYLACENRFIIVRVTIWKKHSKQRYLRKVVNKNRKNVEFWCALSSHLITIDMYCKGQLADQVVAIGRGFIKTRKNFNFFKKIKPKFWKF